MVHLAPERATRAASISTQPSTPKIDLVSKWARDAGHSLDSKLRCLYCGLAINQQRDAQYLRSILHMCCMGGAGIRPHVALHTRRISDGSTNHYMFGSLRVHESISAHFVAPTGSTEVIISKSAAKRCHIHLVRALWRGLPRV